MPVTPDANEPGKLPSAAELSAHSTAALLCYLAVSELAAYLFLRTVIVGSAQRQFQASEPTKADASALPGIYFTVTILGMAMAEGIGLFAVIVLILTHDTRLLLFVGAALAAILALFPTDNRCRALIQRITGSWPTAG